MADVSLPSAFVLSGGGFRDVDGLLQSSAQVDSSVLDDLSNVFDPILLVLNTWSLEDDTLFGQKMLRFLCQQCNQVLAVLSNRTSALRPLRAESRIHIQTHCKMKMTATPKLHRRFHRGEKKICCLTCLFMSLSQYDTVLCIWLNWPVPSLPPSLSNDAAGPCYIRHGIGWTSEFVQHHRHKHRFSPSVSQS